MFNIDKLDKRLITKRVIAFFLIVGVWYVLSQFVNIMQYFGFVESIFGEIPANIIIFTGVATLVWTGVDIID